MILPASNIIVDIGILLIIATFLSYIASKLKQPMILAYIIAGLLLGSFLPDLIGNVDTVNVLSQLGIAFLLFLIGLELSFDDIKHIAKVSFFVGIGQVIFTFVIGYFILRLMDYTVVESVYIAIALTFSSTIIVLKILGDKEDINTLYGKISIGVLLIQDFVALLILISLAGFGDGNATSQNIVFALLKGIAFIVVALLASRYLLSKLIASMAKSQELLFLGSVALCFLFIIIAESLGLTIEIGSFIAGLTLANMPYKLEIGNKIKPLRDLFIVLFFVMLGVQMSYNLTQISLTAAIILSLFVLIGNPLIVLILMGWLGYKKRNSFFTGLIVAQISEFSLILVALGNRLGHLSTEIVSLVTMIGIITITLSVYMMQYNEWLYANLGRWLDVFERKDLKRYIVERLNKDVLTKQNVVLFGCKRLGYNIAVMMREMHKKLLIVDFNPKVIDKLKKEGFRCIYGDIGDYDLFDELRLSQAEIVISTIPDKSDSLVLIKRIKGENKKVVVVVSADNVDDALDLYKMGADYVIIPNLLSGEKVSDILRIAVRDNRLIKDIKKRHLVTLKKLGWLSE